jgi:hypothetical protein
MAQLNDIIFPKITYNGVEVKNIKLNLSTKTKKYLLSCEIYGKEYYIIYSTYYLQFTAINYLNIKTCKYDDKCYKTLCSFVHNNFNNPTTELFKIKKLFEKYKSYGIKISHLAGYPTKTELHTKHGDPLCVIDHNGSTPFSRKRSPSRSPSPSRSRSRVMKPFREFERLPSYSRSRSRSPRRERQYESRSPRRERQYEYHMQVNNKTNILSIRVDEYINKMKQDLDYFSQNSYQYPNSEIIKKIISSNLEMMNMIHQQL